MKQHFPQLQYCRKGSCQVWIGLLRPSPNSRDYLLSIEYTQGYPPKVHVLSPELLSNVPHIYHTDKSLCLYHPGEGSWSSGKLIARTIVPWTAEWLRFYEIWCLTGKWFGPEAPHSGEK
ncbi:hypothetical protein ANRL4_01552 [Anaerolineae bacterium]|nr:hypothetical protein ANRL4_01552 [Anaerolineae bacterium]